jgi:hypothetical protein
MVSAIQTVPSVYIASQIVGPAAVSHPANVAESQPILPSTTVSLGATTAAAVTYTASGLLDTASSSGSATVIPSNSTPVSVVTTDAAQNAASIKLAADLEASTVSENLAVLDTVLADSVARQFLVNTRAVAVGLDATAAAVASQASIAERVETSQQIEVAREATATNSARTLDELLAANQSNTENVVNTAQNAAVQTDSSVTLPLITALVQPITIDSGAITNTTTATIANAVAASNTTTNNLSSTSDVANSLVGNAAFDSAVQAVTAAAQNPAYANLVAQNYASVAASSPLSSTVTATPITPEEAAAAFAISSVADLTQQVTTTGKDNVVKADSAATLQLLTLLPQPVANESTAVVSTSPATTTNVVAASNKTTNSLPSTAEVVNSPVVNPMVDSAVQAVTTVGQNPAYANLVAGNYVRMAASSAQSPSVTATPMRFEEIKPVIAIRSITALTQLGAQNEGNGNPSSGYRQRPAISSAQVRQARAAI